MVLRDVSLSREIDQRRSWEATHDPLTEIFNRREFENRVRLALAELQAVLAAFRQAGVTAVLVTNALGCGIVPMEHVSRLYRDLMGKINQAAAAEADEVYLSVCGITTELKHQTVCLPEVKS